MWYERAFRSGFGGGASARDERFNWCRSFLKGRRSVESRDGRLSVQVEEPDETFLREVAVIRKDFLDVSMSHDVHGNAIHEAILLVGPPLIQRQASEERIVRLRDHCGARIAENLAY